MFAFPHETKFGPLPAGCRMLPRTNRKHPLSRRLRSVNGHLWTIFPTLTERFRPSPSPFGRAFATTVHDDRMGDVRITGLLDEPAGAESLLLILHGHGSDARSSHCAQMARAARSAGLASLRLSLRGADLSGDDIYHGGLTTDLRAALAAPELRSYRKVFVAGYSVGGNIAIRAALEHIDRRIRGVAAICPPVDLIAGAAAFDHPMRRPYRAYVFANLNRVYAATAARRPLPTPIAKVRRARSVRERDELTVVPRFGFASAEDYYRRVQVCHELSRLDVPTLLVASEHDPVVPASTLKAAIAGASPAVTAVWVDRGGHMSFPRSLDFENRVVRWFLANQ